MMKGGLLLLLTAAVWAQEPSFKTRAREVVVPVSVMTRAGKPVEGLQESDFQVFNDGKPQPARMVSGSSPLPIYALIVLQLDDGSAPALAKITKTASLISGYIANDMGIGEPSLAAVVTVGEDVRVVQNFTADPDLLGDTFAKLSATGNSGRLIDGVNLACDLLAAKKTSARRVIVLISESRDVGSRARFSDVVVKAQKNDVVIYSISYSAFLTAFTQKASDRPPPPDQPGLYDPTDHGGVNLLVIPMLLAQLAKTNVAEAFAQSTGGSHQKFTTLHGLEMQVTVIGAEIHNHYMLTFTPPQSQAPGYHELTVTRRSARPCKSRILVRTGLIMPWLSIDGSS